MTRHHSERLFECAFESASERRVAWVRAWDVDEALELFAAELLAEGVDELGELSAALPGGEERRRAWFRPAHRGGVEAAPAG